MSDPDATNDSHTNQPIPDPSPQSPVVQHVNANINSCCTSSIVVGAFSPPAARPPWKHWSKTIESKKDREPMLVRWYSIDTLHINSGMEKVTPSKSSLKHPDVLEKSIGKPVNLKPKSWEWQRWTPSHLGDGVLRRAPRRSSVGRRGGLILSIYGGSMLNVPWNGPFEKRSSLPTINFPGMY